MMKESIVHDERIYSICRHTRELNHFHIRTEMKREERGRKFIIVFFTSTTNNMGRQSVNFQVDESLAIEVRKYAVLYDKSCPQYNEKTPKSNAWKSVGEKLGLEDGEKIYLFHAFLGHV